jgi:hypothetical protein
MNNNDLAALAALGAIGAMYKKYLDGQGTKAGPADAAGAAGSAAKESFAPFPEVGTGGAGGLPADAKRDIRGGGFDNIREDIKRSDMDDFKGVNQYRYIDQPRNNRPGNAGAGSGSGTARVLGGSFSGSPFANKDAAPDVVSEEEYDSGRQKLNTILAATGTSLGAGAASAGAAAYYMKVKREAQLADKRAKLKAEAQRGILKDQALARVTEDRDAAAKKQNEADRAAKAQAQAQADAEAKSKAIQAEIDDELKRLKSKTKGAGVNKSAATTESTVTSKTAKKKRAPIKVETPTDMDDFNRMLRESKVGRATTTTTTPAAGTPKARGVAGKLGLAATALGLGTAANAATDMTAGQRERLAKDVMEGLVSPLGITPGMAGEGSDLGFSDKPLSSAERKKMIEAMSPADRKKMEEALARQNPKLLDAIKRPSAANQRAGGGQIKAKKMASGGMTSTVSSASKRGDGIASKGKTRCKMY